LQYFPLQTGTKIQLRMGYSNNPDALFPVFSGIVTELEPGEETIAITAQSFLFELMTQISDNANTDSWGHLFPAYGRGGIKFTDTAENSTIISKMLKTSNARHFGHWQIDQVSSSCRNQKLRARAVRHHHYKFIDLGTLGGPHSYESPNGPGSRLLNNAGVLAASADTTVEHPDAPDFCGAPDCPVVHAFRWSHGVMADLGAVDDKYSSAVVSINDRGLATPPHLEWLTSERSLAAENPGKV
jgi:hypothetical protein